MQHLYAKKREPQDKVQALNFARRAGYPRTSHARRKSGPRPASLLSALLLWTLIPLALGQQEETSPKTQGVGPVTAVTDVGFVMPESVLFDQRNDVYLVANINGTDGMAAQVDDNGFISRVSPEGEVLDPRWIDGASEEVELNAPKGMAIAGDTLYVADITHVRMFDLTSGEPTGSVAIEGALFLNDVAAAEDGGVYVTDTGVDATFQPTGEGAVFRVREDGSYEEVIAGPELSMVNGVAVTGPDSLILVTFDDPGRILRVEHGEITETTEITPGVLDGVEVLQDGTLLISSWNSPGILRVAQDGTATPVAEGLEGPGDIGYDPGRGRVLVPLVLDNALRIVELTQP